MQTTKTAQQQTIKTSPAPEGKTTTNPLQLKQRKQNSLQQVIQKKLIRPDKTEITKPTEINDKEQAPSPEVEGLITAANKYYLPTVPQDYSAKQIKVLEEKKYILGEDHGDGQWQIRVAEWDHIPKMLEGLKGVTPESQEHKEAIEQSNVSQTGTAEPINNSPSYPLEDRHPYTLTQFLLLQQLLNSYTDSQQAAMLDGTLKECFKLMLSYAEIGDVWRKNLDGTERQVSFFEVGILRAQDDAWDILENIYRGRTFTNSLNDKEVQAIQKTVLKVITSLLELIDKRPLEGVFWKTRQGKDPISNSKSILDLSKSVKGKSELEEAIFQGGILRDKAMVENIKNAAPPLLIQTGNAHVFQFFMDIGNLAVAVYKTDNFDAKILKP